MDQKSDSSQLDQSRLPRFGLPTLFYVTAVFAAAIALMDLWGIIWAVLVLGLWFPRGRAPEEDESKWYVRNKRPIHYGVGPGCAATLTLFVLAMIVMFLFKSRNYQGAEWTATTQNQTRHIALALHNYESANGHFPPAYIADENGVPMHSWRVLLLPYLEEQAVYDQYDFDEPWNGPNNSKLANKLKGGSFASFPYDAKTKMTGFKVVTGPETAFVNDETRSLLDVSAGTANVIMVLDDNSKPINWMCPEDLTIDDATNLFDRKNAKPKRVSENKFEKQEFYYQHVAMFDASVNRLGYLEDPSAITEYFKIGHSAMSPTSQVTELNFASPTSHKPKAEGYTLVAINFLLLVLPKFLKRKKRGGLKT